MKYFLGIDIGSSKTHALIADESGCCAGFGKAWGEYGGVMEIALRTVQMVNYAWIKRIPPTTLGLIGFFRHDVYEAIETLKASEIFRECFEIHFLTPDEHRQIGWKVNFTAFLSKSAFVRVY